MKKMALTLATIVLLGSVSAVPANAKKSKTKITKPSAPTVSSIVSSKAKKGKVNLTISINLPLVTGGSKITGSKVTASGKSCTIKKLKNKCTIKGIKAGKNVVVIAASKNKKGYGAKSSAVKYVVGGSAYSTIAAPVSPTPAISTPVSSNPTLTPTPTPTQEPVTSLCTITGTSGDDYLVGTNGNDVICGNGGRDTILALAGNDVIYAGMPVSTSSSQSTVLAAEILGIRLLSSDSLGDVIDGGDGDDVIYAGNGDDDISGGYGDDVIFGGNGDDDISGESGSDQISGEAGDDALSGGPDLDAIDGGEGNNLCFIEDAESEFTSCRYESTGPTITSVTASPSTVSPGQTLTISVAAADPSGIESVGFYFTRDGVQRDFCGQSTERTSGTSTNGTWTYVCTVPDLVLNGDYVITPYARDLLGSHTNTNGGTLDSTRGSVSVSGGSDDETGPTITSVIASPSTVSPGQTLTISIAATDPSGIEYVGFYFTRDDVQRDFCGQSTELTSGTSTNGTWTYVCTVPALVLNGDYVITPYAQDTLGSYTNSNGGTLDSTRGSVSVSGGSDDTTGPTITSVTATPSTVSPGQTLTISIAATDPSGIDYVGFSFSRDGVQRDFCGQSTQLTSGTSTNGTWTYECTVPANTVIGSYVVTPYAKDNFGNYTNTNGGTLSPTRGSFSLQ
jgi:hypothetical protein